MNNQSDLCLALQQNFTQRPLVFGKFRQFQEQFIEACNEKKKNRLEQHLIHIMVYTFIQVQTRLHTDLMNNDKADVGVVVLVHKIEKKKKRKEINK